MRIILGRRIPREIKLQVKRLWLDGASRDKIATETGISTGSVSAIINDFGKDDFNFELLREVAVKLKNQNMDVFKFAPLVRLYEVFRERGLLTGVTGSESLELVQDRIESLIVGLDVYCFKKGLSIEEFVSLVTNLYATADSMGVSLGRFPAYVEDLRNTIDALRNEKELLEKEKQDALKGSGATLELLAEYNSNKPLVSRIRELENLILWNKVEGEDSIWKRADRNIKEAEDRLGIRIFYENEDPGSELKEMIVDVFDNPDAYKGMLKMLRESYDTRNNKKRKEDWGCLRDIG
jgi:hypothetical protein